MSKKLTLIFILIFVGVFLIFPSLKYSEGFGGCSDSPYANCRPSSTQSFGQLFGGIKYLTTSFSNGSFSIQEILVQNAPVNSVGGSSPDDTQYFNPIFALLVSGLVAGVWITFKILRQKSSKKSS
jgi:hypothetical protein